MTPEITDLGPCCLCEAPHGNPANPVRTIWMLPVEGLDATRGWGCLQCDLPARGASAVLCDRCAARAEFVGEESWKLLKHYMTGPGSRGRAPIIELLKRPAWAHDMSKHPESDRRTSRRADFGQL
jgi:hypothetical protein